MKKQSKVNKERLKTAIRCYFTIDRKTKPVLNDYFTKNYLFEIASRRRFIERNDTNPDIKVFAHWLGNGDVTTPTTPTTAKHFNTTAPKVQIINAKFINMLIDEVLRDLETDLLEIKPFLETKTECRKRETARLHQYGFKRPAPLRLPTRIKQVFNELDLKTPPPPKPKKGTNQTARLYLWLDECKFEVEKYCFTLKNNDLTHKAKELLKNIDDEMTNVFLGNLLK